MDVIDNFVNFQGKNNKTEKHILVTHLPQYYPVLITSHNMGF